MNPDLLQFFGLQKQIFGVCPCCGEFFRLSDCHVFKRGRPPESWMERLARDEQTLADREARVAEREGELREAAREVGRRKARTAIRQVDPVFAPRRLDADDAKVLMDPVEYIVFCGMKSRDDQISRIILLDRNDRVGKARRLQQSIERTVERRRLEWKTLRIQADGAVVDDDE